MTNPDNIVRVRARNGGRASVYEANGWAQGYTSGLLEGHGVTQNTSADMNVLVGGSQTKPDVVLAENPAGYRIALDLVGQQAVAITAPATNSRISAIVAYTDDLSLTTTEDTVTGSPASCGLIVVNGTASVSPTAPTDNEIRTAITADGATGSQAAYAIIATIEVANDATVITNSLITTNKATVTPKNILGLDYSLAEQDTGAKWFDGSAIYKKTVNIGALPDTNQVRYAHGIQDLDVVVKVEGIAYNNNKDHFFPMNTARPSNNANGIGCWSEATNIVVETGVDRTDLTGYVTLYYTKSA